MSAKDQTKANSQKLFTSVDDFLAMLPGEEIRGDSIFREQPVDLKTWLYDDGYMALTIRLSKIQLEWLEAMDDYDPETNELTEFVAEWGKGGGKDFVCALAGLRCAYKLLCLRNMYAYFNMARNTGIQIVNVAYTKEQATNVFFKQLRGLLKGSPWFLRENAEITRSRIKFREELEFVSTSADADSAEGQNIILGVMDEASAFRSTEIIKATKRADGVKVDRGADAIYNVLRTSSTSRFPTVGKVAMISYPRYKDDFIQSRRKKNLDNENAFCSGPYATWEANPNRKREDFEQQYRENPEQAMAMFECIAPFSEDGYVKMPHRFIECVTLSAKIPDLECPIDQKFNTYSPFFQGKPGALYAIHTDLALRKDRCAMAVARQGIPVLREKCTCGVFNYDGNEICSTCGIHRSRWNKILLPTMIVTVLREIKPRRMDNGSVEVDFADARAEVMFLRERKHKIWSLTYDGWQSVDTIQTMNKILGRKTVRLDRYGERTREEDIASKLSVDTSTEPHDTLKEFIYDHRFFITPPPDVRTKEDWESSQHPVAIAFREWRALRLINAKKIDHPIGGGKDFVDSLAGAAKKIAEMPILRNSAPSVGGWSESPVIKR